MRGFIALDKPSGWSSHGVVGAVRRATGIKKVGHAGTLDPMATGLLVVAIGPATRLIGFVQDAEKEYLATARLGIATDSLDADGEVISREPLPVTRDEVEAVLPRFRGPIAQVPPMVSALKKDGRRLYELAREGKEVARDPRPVTIHELELVDFSAGEFPDLSFRVVCSKGTYVRTLGDDIARALGGRAHLVALRRTRIGTTSVEGALDPTDLTPEQVVGALVDPADALQMLSAVTVDEQAAALIRHGRAVSRSHPGIGVRSPMTEDEELAVLDGEGRLLAVYRCAGTELIPKIVLPA